jgi:pyruvate,water dikinase
LRQGIPCIVGTGDATKQIKNGSEITVDCSFGEEGVVWEGKLEFETQEYNVKDLPSPRTKICLNVADPESAFENSFIPNEGVGLARMEFIISNHIKVHPLACLHPEKVDNKVRKDIEKVVIEHGFSFENSAQFFVETLAQGIGMVRLLDFFIKFSVSYLS